MKQHLTCIGCPMGCELVVEGSPSELRVSGNACAVGDRYGRQEVCDPRRILTTTVAVGEVGRVSVKSAAALPKDKIMAAMEQVRKLKVVAPIQSGDVLDANLCGTQIALVATSTVEVKE